MGFLDERWDKMEIQVTAAQTAVEGAIHLQLAAQRPNPSQMAAQRPFDN